MTTNRGRYCPPRICWCGDCAWYVPMTEPDYSRLVATAERASEAQRKSWAQRDEATWMEDE